MEQMEWTTKQWGVEGIHDPTIIKDRNKYYMFSTDTAVSGQPTSGVQIRESDNLLKWHYLGEAFPEIPAEVSDWSRASGLWAPEVKQIGDTYYMYYSASTFGSKTSCIGLATAEHAVGPWHQAGIVIKTNGGQSGQNAIDANLVRAKDGRYWLVYGSFFAGIFIVEIDSKTGFTKVPGDYGSRIAQRPISKQDGAVEGCFIQYNEAQDYYYLFMSYDSLTWSYNIRVARSRQITGPYLDYNGQSVVYPSGAQADQIGLKILGSYQFGNHFAWIAPGHNSLFTEDNKQYLVHHVRIRPNQNDSLGFIRRLYWLKSGWPVVSPNYSSPQEHVSVAEVTDFKTAEQIIWPDTSGLVVSKSIAIDQHLCQQIVDYIIISSYDWEKKITANYLMGLTTTGHGLWLALKK